MKSKLRSVSVQFWDDPYITELNKDEKLIFIYLLTNTLVNLSGIYQIALRKISYDTDIEPDVVNKCIERFSKDKKVFYYENHIILSNFVKNQKYNDNMLKSAVDFFNSLNDSVKTYIKETLPNLYKWFDNPSKWFSYPSESKKKKRKIKKEDEEELKNETINSEFQKYLDEFNKVAIVNKLPQVRSLTTERIIMLKDREKEREFDFMKILEMVKKSPYLLGKVNSFKVSFDWIIKNDTNYIKILEGTYSDRDKVESEKKARPEFIPEKYLTNGTLKGLKLNLSGKNPVKSLEGLLPAEKGNLNSVVGDIISKNKLDLNQNEKYNLKIAIIKKIKNG